MRTVGGAALTPSAVDVLRPKNWTRNDWEKKLYLLLVRAVLELRICRQRFDTLIVCVAGGDLQTAIRYADSLRSWWNLQAESTNGTNFAIGREKNGKRQPWSRQLRKLMLTVAFFYYYYYFIFFIIIFLNAQNPFAVRAKAMLIFFKNHSLANKLPI